jgi:hypothetical protein
VIAAMSLRFPQNVGNFLTACGSVSFSERALLHAVSYIVFAVRHFLEQVQMLSSALSCQMQLTLPLAAKLNSVNNAPLFTAFRPFVV